LRQPDRTWLNNKIKIWTGTFILSCKRENAQAHYLSEHKAGDVVNK